MNINWYPGHMKKTKDMIMENLKIIDVVIEVLDARIPYSSKNPDISKWSKNKKRIILLNKADLVSEKDLDIWKDYFMNNGITDDVIQISALKNDNIKKIFTILNRYKKEKELKMKKKGVKKCSLRLLIAGIPNVGKSLLINKLAKRKAAGVGNKPGFTKGKQWIKLSSGIEMLDTPGILWPKFDSQEVGINLALTGAIKQSILEEEELAYCLIEKLEKRNLGALDKYINEEEIKGKAPHEIILEIAKKKNFMLKGGEYDAKRMVILLLNDYKNGKLGRFSLELPSDFKLEG